MGYTSIEADNFQLVTNEVKMKRLEKTVEIRANLPYACMNLSFIIDSGK
jgi:hypothetical protein